MSFATRPASDGRLSSAVSLTHLLWVGERGGATGGGAEASFPDGPVPRLGTPGIASWMLCACAFVLERNSLNPSLSRAGLPTAHAHCGDCSFVGAANKVLVRNDPSFLWQDGGVRLDYSHRALFGSASSLSVA